MCYEGMVRLELGMTELEEWSSVKTGNRTLSRTVSKASHFPLNRPWWVRRDCHWLKSGAVGASCSRYKAVASTKSLCVEPWLVACVFTRSTP